MADEKYFDELTNIPTTVAPTLIAALQTDPRGTFGYKTAMQTLTQSMIDYTLTGFDTTADTIKTAINELHAGIGAFTQDNILYVGKAGNDLNSGESENDAFLTIAAAMTAVLPKVPSTTNRWAIKVIDGAIYDEDYTVPAYVVLDASRATLEGNIIVGDESSVICLDAYASTTRAPYIMFSKLGGGGTGVVVVTRHFSAKTKWGAKCTGGTLNITAALGGVAVGGSLLGKETTGVIILNCPEGAISAGGHLLETSTGGDYLIYTNRCKCPDSALIVSSASARIKLFANELDCTGLTNGQVYAISGGTELSINANNFKELIASTSTGADTVNLNLTENNANKMELQNDTGIELTSASEVKVNGKLTVTGLIDPTGLILDPQASAPSTDDGTIYYNSTLKAFQLREDGVWQDLDNLWKTTNGDLVPVAGAKNVRLEEDNAYYISEELVDVNISSYGSTTSTTDSWQSFTPTKDGYLMQAGFYISIIPQAHVATITIYQGEGTGGAVLATDTNVPLSSGFASYRLASSPSLTSGQKYTIRKQHVSGPSTSIWDISSTDVYAGGRSSYNPAQDFNVAIWIADHYMELTRNGLINDTAMALNARNHAANSTIDLTNDDSTYDAEISINGTGAITEISADTDFSSATDAQLATKASINTNYYSKSDVDDLLGGIEFDYFLSDTAEGVIVGYNLMYPSDTGEVESTVAAPITGTGILIKSFITESNEPEFTNLLEGIYNTHIHAAKTAGTKDVIIYGEFYKRTTGDVETLLSTTEDSVILTGSNTPYELHFSITSDQIIDATDRLVFKYYGTQSGTGTDPTVTLYLEGSNDSRISVKTDSGFLEAKFVVKNGLSGGQTWIGGTGAGENAVIESTSHGTKGTVQSKDPVDIPNAAGGDLLNLGVKTEAATPRVTIKTRASGFAAPSNTDADSDGDKWVFWNEDYYKGAIGFDTRTMWFQSTEGTLTTNNRFKWYAGSAGTPVEILNMGDDDGLIWNDTGLSIDFRCEGDTDANLLFLQGSTDRVGIGTATPGTKLDVAGDTKVSVGTFALATGTTVNEISTDITFATATDDQLATRLAIKTFVATAPIGHLEKDNVFFVNAAGNNANTGKSEDDAFQDIPTAITAVIAGSPSPVNPFVIKVLGGDNWITNLTGAGKIPDYTSLIATGATFSCNVEGGSESTLECKILFGAAGGGIAITKTTGVGNFVVRATDVFAFTEHGIQNTGSAGSKIICESPRFLNGTGSIVPQGSTRDVDIFCSGQIDAQGGTGSFWNINTDMNLNIIANRIYDTDSVGFTFQGSAGTSFTKIICNEWVSVNRPAFNQQSGPVIDLHVLRFSENGSSTHNDAFNVFMLRDDADQGLFKNDTGGIHINSTDTSSNLVLTQAACGSITMNSTSGDTEISNFTSMGTGNTAYKTEIISGTTPIAGSTSGYTIVANKAKIAGVTAIVDSVAAGNPGISPNYTLLANGHYIIYPTNTANTIYISVGAAQADVASRPFQATIWYVA